MERVTLCNIPCDFYRLHELHLLPDVVRPKMTILDKQGNPLNQNNDMGCAVLPNGDKVWIDETMNTSADGYEAIKRFLAEKYSREFQENYWQKQRDKLMESLFENRRDDVADSMRYAMWGTGAWRYGYERGKDATSYLVSP